MTNPTPKHTTTQEAAMFDVHQHLAEKDAAGEARQARINRLVGLGRVDEATETARIMADAAHQQYPQYARYWATWTLCQVTTDLTSKGGTQAKAGDWVLATYMPGGSIGDSYSSFYSLRLEWNCSIAYGVDLGPAREAYYARREAGRNQLRAAEAVLRHHRTGLRALEGTWR